MLTDKIKEIIGEDKIIENEYQQSEQSREIGYNYAIKDTHLKIPQIINAVLDEVEGKIKEKLPSSLDYIYKMEEVLDIIKELRK